MSDNKVIKGVWIGDELTNIQKLCIRSFQDNGHEFHLYTYGEVAGIPEGTIVLDGNKIVPFDERKRFQNDSHFSDYFRSNVTYILGGWYVDMDIVCLKPFDFQEPCVFVSEYQFSSSAIPMPTAVNGCIIKVPKADPMTREIISRIDGMQLLQAGWIDVGPAQYRRAIPEFGLEKYIQKPEIFDPLWPSMLHEFVNDKVIHIWDWSQAYAAHLRTSYWKADNGLNPNGKYNSVSLFELLKWRHNV